MAGRERRGDVDPDAMWKPGYVAPPPKPTDGGVPVQVVGPVDEIERDQVPDAPSDVPVAAPVEPAESTHLDGLELYLPLAGGTDGVRRSGRRWLRLGVAGAAVVAAVTVAAVVLTRSEPSDDAAALPHLASGIEVRWTASLDGEVGSVASAGDLVLVASADRAATVTALDASSGVERWTARLGRRDSLGDMFVVGDAVAATTTGRIPSLQVIDAATGRTRWERRLRTRDRVVEIDGTLAVVDSVNADLRITALDTATGIALGSIEDPTRFGGGAYVRVDGTSVDVFDVQLRQLATDVELGEVPVDVTVVGDVLLAVGSGRLRAVELDGRERWSMRIDPVDARVVLPSGAGEGQVLVLSSTATTAVDVRGADPVVRWSADGSPVVDPSAPGTRFAPLQVRGGGMLDVVDLTDGSVASTIEVAGGVVRPLYGADGVVLARPTGDDTWRIEGRDYRSGVVRWEADVLGDPTLVERGVVGVRAGEDGLTLTYVGAG